MRVPSQPWWDHPLHRETTRSLSSGGVLDNRATRPQSTDAARAKSADYARFLDTLSEDRKLGIRQGDASGDDIIQWYAEYGSRDDDYPPDGPKETNDE